MSRRSDPRRLMHLDSAVTAVDEQGLARVQSHPHPKAVFDEPGLRSLRRGHSLSRASKRDEDRIALGVHFDTSVGRGRLTHELPVRGERGRVPLGAELTKERRRPLDVGEEQGDRAGWEAPHDSLG
ncbi:MAG TPA: hypothetical protein VFL41_10170 [Gaiellaceae bacterium]|nr:hypothetical protein [Gaiellaceae bacterium]